MAGRELDRQADSKALRRRRLVGPALPLDPQRLLRRRREKRLYGIEQPVGVGARAGVDAQCNLAFLAPALALDSRNTLVVGEQGVDLL